MRVKPKYLYQVVQDSVMTILLVSLMGFHLWGEVIHEWLGIAFLLLVLQHNLLNTYWFKAIFQGASDSFRMLKLTSNALLFGLLIAAIISGVMLSQYVMPDLIIHNASDLVRKTHMTSVHWLQIIIAVHLGIHWKMLANFLAQLCHIRSDSLLATQLLPGIYLALSFYGLYVFIVREMLPYLLLQVDYAFFNFEEPKLLFYFDYLTVIILFAYATRFLLWWLLFRRNK